MTYQIIIDDMICRWGYSKQYIRSLLDKCKGKHVDMRISSLGGDLDHALDIRQQLIDHDDVTVYLTGFVASAATVIAMGAKRVCMSRYAMFLVHKCSNFIAAYGNYNADQMQTLIETLTKNKQENDRIDAVIADLYSKKTGKSISELLSVLKEGRWLTAQEALDYGFVDELIEDEGAKKQNLTPELTAKFNAFGITLNGLSAQEEEPEQQSLLRQILDSLKSFTSGFRQMNASAEKSTEEESDEKPQNTPCNDTNTESTMKLLACYAAVMACLSAKELPVNEDGSVTLSQEEMELIDERLSTLNNDVAERDKTIEELNQKVENLMKQPGADTNEMVDDSENGTSKTDMYQSIKNYL